MKQSPSWEANTSSIRQEILGILCKPMVHYRVHKSPPPVAILSQIKPVHASPSKSWKSILILSSHLRLGLPRCLFPSVFPTNTLYATLLSSIRSTCPAHPILLDLITQIIFCEQYSSSSSSCSLRHMEECVYYWHFSPPVLSKIIIIVVIIIIIILCVVSGFRCDVRSAFW